MPILLVEDDADDVVFLKRAIKLAGIRNPLHVVATGQEAIDYMAGTAQFSDREQHPLPGLVILDLNLPQKTGFEVLHWIRYHPQLVNTFVVVLTSSNQDRDRQEAFRLGANSYLVKPTDPDRLTRMIEQVVARWKEFRRGS
jgi:CheY-like chemotaxis protein